MEGEEYMKVQYKHFPEDIRKRYKLDEKVTDNGYIYIKIKKGMYGLKQAVLLAFEHLKSNLAPHVYDPIPHTNGMWKHKTRNITFCLCIDDFGVKHIKKVDVDHLLNNWNKTT